jgi:hypothetical protein
VCYVCLFVCLWLRQHTSGTGPPHSWGFQITHNDAPHSVGLLWTSDQLAAETSTWQHTTLTADKHPCPRWDSNPQSQQASGRRPTTWTVWPLGLASVLHKIRRFKVTHYWDYFDFSKDYYFILIYKSQQDVFVTEFILSENCSTCFWCQYQSFSGAQNNCNYNIL